MVFDLIHAEQVHAVCQLAVLVEVGVAEHLKYDYKIMMIIHVCI